MMYAYDFLIKGNLISDKVFLSGDNECVKNLVIQKITSVWGVTGKVYATKNSELQGSFNQPIFGVVKVAHILSGKAEPNKSMHYVIRVSSKAMTKKYKDMGFEEITCGNFFPNQVENFCKSLISELHINIAPVYGKFLCVTCSYDLVSVINVVKVLSYLDQSYVASLSYADFSLLCGTLTISDETAIVNYFVEGNYSEFLSRLHDNPRIVTLVLKNLMYTLLKAQSISSSKKPTWYQQKLLTCLGRMELCGVNRVILELQALCGDYLLQSPQIMLRLHKLIRMIKGVS
jgi:hypothetical protein